MSEKSERSPELLGRARSTPTSAPPIDIAVALLIGIGLLLRLAFLKEHFDFDWEPDGYKHVVIS